MDLKIESAENATSAAILEPTTKDAQIAIVLFVQDAIRVSGFNAATKSAAASIFVEGRGKLVPKASVLQQEIAKMTIANALCVDPVPNIAMELVTLVKKFCVGGVLKTSSISTALMIKIETDVMIVKLRMGLGLVTFILKKFVPATPAVIIFALCT